MYKSLRKAGGLMFSPAITVKEVLYRGNLLSEKGHEEQEVKAKIPKGYKKYGMLKSLMKSKLSSRRMKIRTTRRKRL